jgi:RimJ/RimL family protein N-acetyltransferase
LITKIKSLIGDSTLQMISLRGKGIGSATLDRLMSIVFDEMIFKKMKTRVLEDNKIAIELYEKMGFKKEGRPKQQLIRRWKTC